MADPEVVEFGNILHLRNGGGGKRRVIAGSVCEPKAIMRNYHLDLELKETKKRIDADKVVQKRNFDYRKLSMRSKMLERNIRLHEQFGTHPVRNRQNDPHERQNMKLLWTVEADTHAHISEKRDLRTRVDDDDDLSDVRPRAISLESYFRQKRSQQQQKRRVKFVATHIGDVAARNCDILGGKGVTSESDNSRDFAENDQLILPDIHEHGSLRKGSVDSNIIIRDLNSALSGRLSPSPQSLPKAQSPEESASPLLPRRLSRLRSVTIGQTQDLEAMMKRQTSQDVVEKVRPRSHERMISGDPDDLEEFMNRGSEDVSEMFKRRSYERVTGGDLQRQYSVVLDDADRMLRKCRLNHPRSSREEHFVFDREVKEISNVLAD